MTYHKQWKEGRREAGYVSFMLWLTPSAAESLAKLLEINPEMNRTDIVCKAIKELLNNSKSGE